MTRDKSPSPPPPPPPQEEAEDLTTRNKDPNVTDSDEVVVVKE